MKAGLIEIVKSLFDPYETGHVFMKTRKESDQAVSRHCSMSSHSLESMFPILRTSETELE